MEKEEEFHDSAVRCLFDGKQFFFITRYWVLIGAYPASHNWTLPQASPPLGYQKENR